MCSGFLESSVQLLLPRMGWARDCSRCTLSPFVIESGKTVENKGHSFLETQKPGKRKGWESEAKSFFPRIPGQPKLTSFPFAPASFRNKQRADRWCFYFTPELNHGEMSLSPARGVRGLSFPPRSLSSAPHCPTQLEVRGKGATEMPLHFIEDAAGSKA